MQKIFIFLLLISTSAYSQLPSTGTISFNNIRSHIGVPSQTNFSIYGARAGAYGPLNPYATTKPKTVGDARLSDWYSYCHTCTTLYYYTIYVADVIDGFNGWSSAANACAGTRSNPVYAASSSSSLAVGATLYGLLPDGTTYAPFNSRIDIWYYSGGIPFQMTSTSSNTISSVSACTGTYSFSLSPNPILTSTAGSSYGTVTTVGGSVTLTFSVFGGASGGTTASGDITITGIGTYTSGTVTSYTTYSTSITITTPGTYNIAMQAIFSGSAGQFVKIQ